MTRQVLYRFKCDKVVPEKMAMNVFEDHLKKLKDVPAILSETIQLENYIFRKNDLYDQENSVNDLQLGMNFLPEIA